MMSSAQMGGSYIQVKQYLQTHSLIHIIVVIIQFMKLLNAKMEAKVSISLD